MLFLLCKLDRLASWLLLIVFVLYIISGYGMTKGLMDCAAASTLHSKYLIWFGAPALIVHTFWAIHLAFKRWRIWNKFTGALLILLYASLCIFILYTNFFNKKMSTSKTTQNIIQSTEKTQEIAHIFTKEELSFHDGKDGRPAYVAVDGLVYDLSSIYKNGTHHGYEAGLDLSEEFHNEHSSQILSFFTIVGAYIN